jgi:hypothetical protein
MAKGMSPADVRGHLDRILDRARQDAEFGGRLKTDPAAALRESGLYEDAVDEAAQEIQFAVRPVSELRCTVTCDYTTCWISACDHWGTYATNN